MAPRDPVAASTPGDRSTFEPAKVATPSPGKVQVVRTTTSSSPALPKKKKRVIRRTKAEAASPASSVTNLHTSRERNVVEEESPQQDVEQAGPDYGASGINSPLYGGVGGMNNMYGGGMYGAGMYGMMSPMMMGGPFSGVYQLLFGVQSVVMSLGQAVQLIGMNQQALQQALDAAWNLVDHSMATFHELRQLEATNSAKETPEQKQKRRRLKALRWALVMGTSWFVYKLLRRIFTSSRRKRLGYHQQGRHNNSNPYSTSSGYHYLPMTSSYSPGYYGAAGGGGYGYGGSSMYGVGASPYYGSGGGFF